MKPFSHTIALLTQSLGSWGSEAGYRCWRLAACWSYPGSCHSNVIWNERIYRLWKQPSPFRLYDWRGSNHFKICRFWKAISHSLVTHPFRGGRSGSIDLSPSWQPALTNRIWVRNLAWHQACDGWIALRGQRHLWTASYGNKKMSHQCRELAALSFMSGQLRF